MFERPSVTQHLNIQTIEHLNRIIYIFLEAVLMAALMRVYVPQRQIFPFILVIISSSVGFEFLAKNAERPEVTVTDSGLQYEVIHSGEGEKPTAQSTVRVDYHGTLLNGDVFDSSYDRGQPAEFPVGGVIKGWTEALQLMNVGDKWRLTIPHDLAYGEQGAGGAIKPYSTLVFDVELHAILG